MDTLAVRNLLDAYWDHRLPVNPEDFAEALGYEIRPFDASCREFQGLSGMAAEEHGRKIIYVNRADHKNRQRFTIAHELGHHLLGHTHGGCRQFRDSPLDYSTMSHSWLETDANKFAAELLMPSEAITVLVERRGITEVRQLANIFDVSESAMFWRLKNLRII